MRINLPDGYTAIWKRGIWLDFYTPAGRHFYSMDTREWKQGCMVRQRGAVEVLEKALWFSRIRGFDTTFTPTI